MALRRPHFSCDSPPRASVHLLLLLEVPYSHRAWGLRLLVCRGASPSRGAVVGTNREQRNVSRLPISRWGGKGPTTQPHNPCRELARGWPDLRGRGQCWDKGARGVGGQGREAPGGSFLPPAAPAVLDLWTHRSVSAWFSRHILSVGFSLSDETVVEVPPCSTVTTAHALGGHGSAHSRSLKH